MKHPSRVHRKVHWEEPGVWDAMRRCGYHGGQAECAGWSRDVTHRLGSDGVADLPGRRWCGEFRMVGIPDHHRVAGVILKVTRQRVWNLIGRGDLPRTGHATAPEG
jgi:hypothetical protein